MGTSNTLELSSLNLQGIEIFDFVGIYQLRIKELNISNTLISNLANIRQFADLNKLYVRPKQFSNEQLKEVPPSIIVEELNLFGNK